MWWLNLNRRFLRISLRSILVGTTILAAVFAFAGQTGRSYYREQAVFSKIPNLYTLPVYF